MSITLSAILELPLLQEVRVVAGVNGLSNRVDGISLFESPGSEQWLSQRSLVLNNSFILQYFEDEPEKLAEILYDSNVAGIMFKADRFFPLPPRFLERADALDLPVITFPNWLSAGQLISAISYEIMRNEVHDFSIPLVDEFLRDLTFQNEDRATLRKKMSMLGWEEGKTIGLAILYDCPVPDSEKDAFLSVLEANGFPHGFSQGANRVIFSDMDGTKNPSKELTERSNALIAELERTHPRADGSGWLLGMGAVYPSLSLLSSSYHEAKTALLAGIAESLVGVIDFRRLGFLGVLFGAKNWHYTEIIVNRILSLLKEHDEEHDTEFVKTLYSYAMNNQSAEKTAQDLFVHRNTVNYRLRSINKIIMDLFIDSTAALNMDMLCHIIRWFSASRENMF